MVAGDVTVMEAAEADGAVEALAVGIADMAVALEEEAQAVAGAVETTIVMAVEAQDMAESCSCREVLQ